MAKRTKDILCKICGELRDRTIIRKDNQDNDDLPQQQQDGWVKPIPLGNYNPRYKNAMDSEK